MGADTTSMSWYQDLFAPLYQWNLARWSGDKEMASSLAAIGMAAGVIASFVAVSGTTCFFLFPNLVLPDFLIAAIIVMIFGGHWLMFLREGRYEELLDRFDRQSKEVQRRRRRLAWTFVFVSVLIIPLLMVLLIESFG